MKHALKRETVALAACAMMLSAGYAAAQPVVSIYTNGPALFGGGASAWANAIDMPDSSGRGHVVYRARATGGGLVLGVNDTGLIRGGPSPHSPLSLLAVSAGAANATGLPAGLSWLVSGSGPASVNDDGVVAAQMGLTGPGVGAGNNSAIVRFGVSGAVVLLRTGGAAPGVNGQTISGFSAVYAGKAGGAGEFIVVGSHSGGGQCVWRCGPTATTLLYVSGQFIPTQTGGSVAGTTIDGTLVDETGAVALLVGAGGFSVAVDKGDGSGLRLWVQPEVTTVPTLGPTAKVQSWGGATLAGGRLICWSSFIGTTSGPALIEAGPSVASLLIAPGTAVPDMGPSAQIGTIFSPPAFDPDGGTLFRANVTGSGFGASVSSMLYLPPAWLGGAPRLVVRAGQTLTVGGNARTVSSVADFNNSVSRDGRVLALARLVRSGNAQLDQCIVGGRPGMAGGVVPLITQNTSLSLPNGSNPALGSSASTSEALDDRGRAWLLNFPSNSTVGVNITAPGVCGLADCGGTGGTAGADALLNNNDFIVYINLFFSASSRADLGKVGGVYGQDGLFDNNDFIVFIDEFFTGCP